MATYRQERSLLLEAVGALYEAAANPALWPETLKSMAQLFAVDSTQISVLNARDANLNFFVYHGLNVDDDGIRRYAELTVSDPFSLAMMRLPGKALRDGQVESREVYHASPIYRELLCKVDIEYRMAVAIGGMETQFSAIALSRGISRPDFDDDDVSLLSDLVPHFRRAMDLYEALATRQAGQDFALSALDRLSIGVAIVSPTRSVLFMNEAGRGIVEEQGGLIVRNGQLMTERSEGSEQLSRVVRQMASADGAERGEFLAFQRSNGREPLLATVSPLHRHDALPVPDAQARHLAIVIFTDPERQLEVPEELLQRLYGLTPAEAALLAQLVGGQSLDEAAEALGIVKETARKRLRDIFQKTGTGRQAELVRHVLANPVWITEQAKRPARAGNSS